MNQSGMLRELSREFKTKVSKLDPGPYNINISRSNDGTYRLETAFCLYRDARLLILSLFKWVERNGETLKHHNMFIDIKFMDEEKGPFKGTMFNTGTKIEKIDKLKMILDFNESFIYDTFPSRRYGFNSKSIARFEPNQKFIPREDSPVDPKFYTIPDTTDCGINFETLNKGFLRLQYIGGKDYVKKPQEILHILSEFCISSWNCTINPGYSKENITSFEKIILRHVKIRESYLDYLLFQKNFPSIKLTVDLSDNPKTLYTFYPNMRDRLYDILTNIEFKGEILINYDSSMGSFQIKDATIKVNSVKNIEFVTCEIEFGSFDTCDFYKCKLVDCLLYRSNLFLETEANRCKLIDSVVNRTSEISSCEFEGFNGALNGVMKGGIFRSGGIGVHAEISSDVIVIEYRKLTPGYMVAGDKVLIPSEKKYKPL